MVVANDYDIVRPLSEGGMGAVYVVKQRSTGHERALKVMHPQLTANDALRTKFVREAQISAQIESEHIVQVLAAGIDQPSGTPWLVMELLRGQSLGEFVDERGPPDPALAREIFRQLGHGLAAAHRAGIVHRDLKPDNIFLAKSMRSTETFTVKILDFGIAKVAAEAKTRASAAIGSPLWMAPEQAEVGGEITPATDVWSLGLMAFFVVTGKSFWRSGDGDDATPVMVIKEAMVDELRPASARARETGSETRLPPRFDEWFGRCVVRDPAMRFANAEIALAAFEQLFPGEVPARLSIVNASDMGGLRLSNAPPVSVAYDATIQVSAPPSVHQSPRHGIGASKAWVGLPLIMVVALAAWLVPRFTHGRGRVSDRAATPASSEAPSTDAAIDTSTMDAMRLFWDKSDARNLPKAIAALQKACEAGEQDGCAGLGLAAYRGEGAPKDTAAAVRLFDAACNANSLLGCTGLGIAYVDGTGVRKDTARGFTLHERACDGGAMFGCYNLANAYTYGSGVAKDDERAVSLYERACAGGIVAACTNLGSAYDNGSGVPKDERHADELYEKACTGGNLLACTYLGIAYASGSGVLKDEKRAAELYDRACLRGYEPACKKQASLGAANDPSTSDGSSPSNRVAPPAPSAAGP